MKHIELFEYFKKDGESKSKKSGWLKSSGKPGEITEDADAELLHLDTDGGFIEIGTIWGESGEMEDTISIYAMDNSPQGYTGVKVSDLIKLLKAYNDAEWSQAKIKI